MREAGGPVGSCNQIRAKKRGREMAQGWLYSRTIRQESKGAREMVQWEVCKGAWKVVLISC